MYPLWTYQMARIVRLLWPLAACLPGCDYLSKLVPHNTLVTRQIGQWLFLFCSYSLQFIKQIPLDILMATQDFGVCCYIVIITFAINWNTHVLLIHISPPTQLNMKTWFFFNFQGHFLLYESMLNSVIHARDKWLKKVSPDHFGVHQNLLKLALWLYWSQ